MDSHSGVDRLTIRQETIDDLEAYGSVPMTLLVERIFRVETTAAGFELHEELVETPWVKDYEAFDEDRPVNLAKKYDFSVRAILAAYEGDLRVGGAIVAPGEPDWFGADAAVLVDIRVDPEHRRRGIGQALFAAGVAWARERGLRALFIETQHVNVPGCRFYAAQGAVLDQVIPGAYPKLPDEIELIWKL
ncbi:MAG: GNAT family N-acetyltransferase, partial [Dehalococcoidia bacterium]